jgi:hypothetical protein
VILGPIGSILSQNSALPKLLKIRLYYLRIPYLTRILPYWTSQMTVWHIPDCYITFIMLIFWSRGRSRQPQKYTFSLPKWVENTQRAPQNPPECQISSKSKWLRHNIEYLAFRWGIGGFELGGELSETGWVDCSGGRPKKLQVNSKKCYFGRDSNPKTAGCS